MIFIDKYIVISNNIFSNGEFFKGHFIVDNNKISKLSKDNFLFPDEKFKVFDFKENIVMPTLVDCHAFFTGYYVRNYGVDISLTTNKDKLIKIIKENIIDDCFIGFGLSKNVNNQDFASICSKIDPSISILLINWDEEYGFVNDIAKKRFDFDCTDFSSEKMWKLLKFVLSQKKYVKQAFLDYQNLIISRGVGASKEMVFDDSYGLVDVVKEIEDEKMLKVNISIMSQPVSKDLSIETANNLLTIANSDKFRFDGFNQMVDGSISVKEADIEGNYEDGDKCIIHIDYEKIEKETLLADKNGYRFSLHGQGDRAISKIIDIYEKCNKDSSGKLLLRHAITDLEFTKSTDLSRMAKLGIFAEIYPQILSIYDDSEEKINLTFSRVGERAVNYWNRRKMIDEGVIISCGTDLPLVVQDLGASIYHACFHKFSDGTSFQTNNTLSITELLQAWTINGAKNLGEEKNFGSLEAGKNANFIVLNMSPQQINDKSARELKVIRTYIDGEKLFDSSM